jgi:L-rhamnose-H+ transport protein
MVSGFLLVLLAAVFQGSFVVPMTRTRGWRWEHTWLAFSCFGMLLLNWALGLVAIPNLIDALSRVALSDIGVLCAVGAGWGVGAILFGLAMTKLGMSLGYPVVMGLIACLGSLFPLAVLQPGALTEAKGLVLLAGTALAVAGISLCSAGAARRQPEAAHVGAGAGALTIGVVAGVLSCLPNVGMSFGGPVVQQVVANGVSEAVAANAVWVIFFSAGGVVNVAWCLRLILQSRERVEMPIRNFVLTGLMALTWIGSFYLYGMGARSIGSWGLIAGWPVFIFVSIAVGVIWGFAQHEWRDAPRPACRLRNSGLATLACALPLIAASQAL